MVIWKYFPALEGGAERQCRKIVEELSQRKVQCVVLTAHIDRSVRQIDQYDHGMVIRLGRLAWLEGLFQRGFLLLKKVPGLRERELTKLEFWMSIPFSMVARFSFMHSLRRYLREHYQSIDILHVHEGHWIAGAVVWASQGLNVPVVCKEATYPHVKRLGYDTPLRRKLSRLREKAYFIAITDAIKESLIDNGIEKNRISIIPNGVESPEEAASPLDSRSIIYIGNFTQGSYQKAFDILFQAWVFVQQARTDLTLVVLGGGDSSPWKKLLREQGALSSVRFMGRVNDVGSFLITARMKVLPSRVEGLSNALLEAMSWGVPVIVSDIPAHYSIINHRKNGIVVPVDDSESLAHAIIELAENDALVQDLSVAARKTIQEKYSIEIVTKSLMRLYHQLMQSEDKLP